MYIDWITWRLRSPICHLHDGEQEGLWYNSVWVLMPENQGGCSFKSWHLNTWEPGAPVSKGRRRIFQLVNRGKKICFSSALLFYLHPQQFLCLSTLVRAKLLFSVCWFKCYWFTDTPQNNVLLAAGYRLAQSNWHIKLTMIPSLSFVPSKLN